MDESVIYSSKHVRVTCRADGFYIESFSAGMSLEEFNDFLSKHPEILVTSFMAVRNALMQAPKPPMFFAELKERIEIELGEDDVCAYVKLNVSSAELSSSNRANIVNEIHTRLSGAGIVYGIKFDVLHDDLVNAKRFLTAEGIPPVHGKDSIINMYTLKEVKPEILDDDTANHYNINLINHVKAGDWLGERIEATRGIAGKSVKGTIIQPRTGKSLPLLYDKSTVCEVETGDRTILYARCSGAVNYKDSRIGVSNYLEIGGDVDFRTGNIEFDGSVSVKGTIADNFSLKATGDVEIQGVLGLSNAKEVVSTEGSIVVKGGIAGKGKTVIHAGRDVFTKFVENATIVAGGAVHVGFSCINSTVSAKEIIFDSPKGQIIGGTAEADVRVVAPLIGSEAERRTIVRVKGFDRAATVKGIEKLTEDMDNLKTEQNTLRSLVAKLTDASSLTPGQRKSKNAYLDRLIKLRDEIYALERKKKDWQSYLKIYGEGEITVQKKVYPNVLLEICKHNIEVLRAIPMTTFYYEGAEIKQK